MGPVRVSMWVCVCGDRASLGLCGGIRSWARERNGCLGQVTSGRVEHYWTAWVRVELWRDPVLI